MGGAGIKPREVLKCGIPDRKRKVKRDDETEAASMCLENSKHRSSMAKK